jgi:DNA-binding beta-propeller fold protein YncE
VDGKLTTRSDPAPDSVTVIAVEQGKARVVANVEVPTSVIGPPFSIAMTPDARLALVTAPLYVDPNSNGGESPDNAVSVIDLRATPPRVLGRLTAGKGAAGVSITPDGRTALVANRREGSVSVLDIDGTTVRKRATLQVGTPASGLGYAAISPAGDLALVSRDGDNTLSVLAIRGREVTDAKRDFGIGLAPYGMAIAHDGSLAVVANVSQGRGDEDTLSIVSLSAPFPRVVNTVSVGQTPEGIALSPDGKWCAVALLNGSNKPVHSPFFNPYGLLLLLRVQGTTLTRISELPIGAWPQGLVFAADSQTLLVGSMAERNVRIISVAPDGALEESGPRLSLPGGNVALRATR